MNRLTAATDVVIFGGGVAGLWLLNRLKERGFSVILFESGSLGGGQTHKSQGIIHGGTKYALHGVISNEANVLGGVPDLWRACLQGKGEVDLSHVPVLSQHQYLWAPGKFTAKLAGFFAGATLASKVEPLPPEAYPAIFKHAGFRGEIFTLDEMVVDVPSLVRELAKTAQDALYKIEPLSGEELKFDEQGNLLSATVYMAGKPIEVTAQKFIFTAGAGNEMIIRQLNQPDLAMQRRPLHMVLVKPSFNHPLYAHCLGIGKRPRITITTHYTQEGKAVWYLGGQLAEDGIYLDTNKQIKATQDELGALFPWLNFSDAEYATFMIDRAEPLQKNHLKPENIYIKHIQNMMIAWPTKLCLAPKLAEEVVQALQGEEIQPQFADIRALRSWPMPPLANPIWEREFCKSVA